MKSVVALVASVVVCGSAHAKSKVVIDFSEDHTSEVFETELYDFQKKAIFTQLFGAYAENFEQCGESQNKELIETVHAVSGSFSRQGADEVVLAFMSSECPGSHAGQHSNLVLVRGTKVVAATRDIAATSIEKVWDWDGDGLLDVITAATGGNQGYFTTMANTVTFKGGAIRKLDYVSGRVAYKDCGAHDDNKGHQYVAVFRPSGNPFKTIQENFVRTCGGDSQPGPYRSYSFGEMKIPGED